MYTLIKFSQPMTYWKGPKYEIYTMLQCHLASEGGLLHQAVALQQHQVAGSPPRQQHNDVARHQLTRRCCPASRTAVLLLICCYDHKKEDEDKEEEEMFTCFSQVLQNKLAWRDRNWATHT